MKNVLDKPMKGVLTPIITPFDGKGQIDFNSLSNVLDFLIEKQKVDGIVVGGTTGEVVYLDNQEYKELVRSTIDYVNSRVPVIAGVEAKSFENTLERIKVCNQLPLNALLIPPIGKRLSQQEIFNQYVQFNSITNKPIIVYNKNRFEGSKIEISTIIRISSLENVIALKDSGEDLEQAKQILEDKNRSFYFLSGCDELNFPLLKLGSDGTISAASHIIGKEMVSMYSSYYENMRKRADQINSALLPKVRYLFQVKKPGLIKKLYKKGGLISSDMMRMPLDFSKVNINPEMERSLLLTAN